MNSKQFTVVRGVRQVSLLRVIGDEPFNVTQRNATRLVEDAHQCSFILFIGIEVIYGR